MRIVATGLCHTDISLREVLPAEMFPRVFGHEGAGVVEEVGADITGIAVGDHVVLSLRVVPRLRPLRAGRGRLLREQHDAQLHGHADGRLHDLHP